ncbi:unnamed protein product [Blepharisma stoltei]|uniref:Uncharacterized protein n=1 Tax=Blepharisma stoltei TaxID=1481888 RepID=A0AAU9JJH1_9CILI|nr:unnamed protein product [Blepharisma stoltei]
MHFINFLILLRSPNIKIFLVETGLPKTIIFLLAATTRIELLGKVTTGLHFSSKFKLKQREKSDIFHI